MNKLDVPVALGPLTSLLGLLLGNEATDHGPWHKANEALMVLLALLEKEHSDEATKPEP
jgi:hypothetical protein